MLAIPFKRGARRAPVDYLDQKEVGALLSAPKDMTPADERDLTLFALMLNTGARVSEVLDLRIQDVRVDPPYQVRLRGKGGKVRVCPIWAHSARRVRRLLARSDWPVEPDRPLLLHPGGNVARPADSSTHTQAHHRRSYAQDRHGLRHHQPVARSRFA